MAVDSHVAIHLARLLKEERPEVVTVLGGVLSFASVLVLESALGCPAHSALETWTPVSVVAVFATLCGFSAAAVIAGPIALLADSLGKKDDLEAGDSMLGGAGAWLVASQILACMLVCVSPETTDEETWEALLVTVLGVALGAAALAVFAARANARRRWCKRLLRGELEGWAVRPAVSDDDFRLPPICGLPRSVSDIDVVQRIERITQGDHGDECPENAGPSDDANRAP